MEGRSALSEIEGAVHVPSVEAVADARERDIERILIGEQEIQDKLASSASRSRGTTRGASSC
jgi:hypothetical protein